jgi:hypothetical protein
MPTLKIRPIDAQLAIVRLIVFETDELVASGCAVWGIAPQPNGADAAYTRQS